MKYSETIMKAAVYITILISAMGIQAAASDISSDYRIQRIEGNQSDNDLKPAIDSISDPTIVWDGDAFTAEFTVYFHGSERIYVELEEEYDSNVRSYRYDGQGMVHVKTGKISGLFYSWIHIEAHNEYGSTKRTLEFPPHFGDLDSEDPESTYIKIVCDDTSENSTLSAYLPHAFKVENRDRPISNPEWTLSLPLNDGSFEYISLSDDGFSCSTDPMDSSSSYKISEQGIMEATLQFKGKLDDETTLYMQYDINFDFKPFIEYAVIERIEDEAPSPSYNAYYKVKYYGADSIRVYVEEEYKSDVKLTYIHEPNVAFGCAAHIKAPYKAWIGFVAENRYGKDTYTIELLPYGEVANSVDSIIDGSASSESTASLIEVYDVNGRKIADVNDIPEAYRLPVKGILILKEQHRTRKIMVK